MREDSAHEMSSVMIYSIEDEVVLGMIASRVVVTVNVLLYCTVAQLLATKAILTNENTEH